MARIGLSAITHAYGSGPPALKGVDHVFEDGAAYALLGPSGCGKTTLLNIISGLVTPSRGRVLFDDKDVTGLSTRERNIAQVFQFPVIYDTMTVAQNLAFPLRNRGVPKAEAARRVAEILDLIGLSDRANQRARGLTADDKQKISLGRGLVRDDVAAILFDEPLTVIDPHLKWKLRTQLKTLHRKVGATMVYVTHDQTEALTFADRVAVMMDGQIVQLGTPAELFEKPKHAFVGYFIGSPGMNLIPAALDGGRAMVGELPVPIPPIEAPPGAKVELGVRPEHVRLSPKGLPVAVERVEDIGRARIVHARLSGHPIAIRAPEGAAIPAEPHIAFEEGRLGVFVDGWRAEGA